MVVKAVKRAVGRFFAFSRSRRTQEAGYLLPVVIVLGMAVGTVSVVALQSTANNSTVLNDQYYDSTAREAAKAGIAAAYKCLNATNTFWTTNMTGTNCSGGGPEIKVTVGDRFDSTYSVSPPDNTTYPPSGDNVRIIVTSIGTVTIRDGAGNPVKTIKKSIRALGKVTTIPGGGPGTTPIIAADKLSTGPSTACAIGNEWAYCWGSNANNMLGNGNWNFVDGRSRVPVEVASTAVTAQVSTSSNPCDYNFWSFNIPDCAGARSASAMANKKVKKISVGTNHVCAIATDTSVSTAGRVYCWGKNDRGQLGDLTESDRSVPVAVYTGGAMARSCTHRNIFNVCDQWDIARDVGASALSSSTGSPKDVADISSGDGFTCAVTSDGEVSCWGLNSRGQLGNDTRNNAAIPTALSKSSTVQTRTCVNWEYGITYWFNPNDKWCGTNGYNPAADTVPSALIGKQIRKLARVKDASTMCALTTDYKTLCWGRNDTGQAGNGGPLPASSTGTATERHGNPNSCGPNSNTQNTAIRNARNDANSGRDTYYDALRPVAVQISLVFDDILITGTGDSSDDGTRPTTSVVARTADTKRLYHWGGKKIYDESVQVRRNSDTVGGDHCLAIATVRISYSGQTTPAGPLYDTASAGALQGQPIALYAGDAVNSSNLFCAQAAAAIYCDAHGGMVQQGQLGNGYTCTYFCQAQNGVKAVSLRDSSNNPTWLFDKNVIALDMGSEYTCATADNGAIGCWGLNSSGQLGDGSTTNRSRPVGVVFPTPTATPPTPTGPTTGSTTTYDIVMYF